MRTPLTKTLIFVFIMVLACEAARCGEDRFTRLRRDMVKYQIKSRGVTDDRVLRAMDKVERHLFVPSGMRNMAYEDTPLPIGEGQTISQPYIVAFMTEAAAIGPGDKVLEIGTGSGYQAAVLAELAKEVYTIEILKPLADASAERLKAAGYKNVTVRWGNGYDGWPEKAPFDVIMVTAAPDSLPENLVGQLKTGGRMVVPIGRYFQELYLVTRTASGTEKKALLPVRFVPMTGEKNEP